VALATREQLTAVLDLDLWRSAEPGRDEHFDVERFGEWLELLADASDADAAQLVAAIDDRLLVAGLTRHIRVFDLAALVSDPGSRGGLECEVGGYFVSAIRTDAWDAIVAVLRALDTAERDRFHIVMRECRRLSNSTPEIDGLDERLMEPEQLLHDVARDREHRRSQQGYLTPADARAFLQMARRRHAVPRPINPFVAAYMNAAAGAADVVGAQHLQLAFLANALMAGCSIQSRSFTPQEAADAAVAVCDLGFEHATSQRTHPQTRGTAGLIVREPSAIDYDFVSAFEVGWTVLHDDVSMFVAEQLLVALSQLRCSDIEIQKGLRTLRAALKRQRAAGTPWAVRDALDVIAMLDVPAWASVSGLLDECPVIPAVLTATLEGWTGAISPTAFEFISTRGQLGTIREFMARFPDILNR
jgi:hypothetical protein